MVGRWEASEEAEALKKEYSRAKRRRNRWGGSVATGAPTTLAPPPAAVTAVTALSESEVQQARVNEINATLKVLPPEREGERAALNAERNELVKAIVAAKFGGASGAPVKPRSHMIKVPLPEDTNPGGVGNLIGLVIGPRGKTQQRLQNETGCVIVVRGKGATKLENGMINHDDEEETHVRITGPTEEAVLRAKAHIDVLIDFNSEEGEEMRQRQWRELKVLNGTLQEDKDIDYKKLFTDPQRAAVTGPLGQGRALALPAPLSSAPAGGAAAGAAGAAAGAAASTTEESEYALLMSEIGGLETPPGAAADAAAAPPPPHAPPPGPPPPGYPGAPPPYGAARHPGMAMAGAPRGYPQQPPGYPPPPAMVPRPPPGPRPPPAPASYGPPQAGAYGRAWEGYNRGMTMQQGYAQQQQQPGGYGQPQGYPPAAYGHPHAGYGQAAAYGRGQPGMGAYGYPQAGGYAQPARQPQQYAAPPIQPLGLPTGFGQLTMPDSLTAPPPPPP